jgi:hypothetical protein
MFSTHQTQAKGASVSTDTSGTHKAHIVTAAGGKQMTGV